MSQAFFQSKDDPTEHVPSSALTDMAANYHGDTLQSITHTSSLTFEEVAASLVLPGVANQSQENVTWRPLKPTWGAALRELLAHAEEHTEAL